jgi:hypothetical protein
MMGGVGKEGDIGEGVKKEEEGVDLGAGSMEGGKKDIVGEGGDHAGEGGRRAADLSIAEVVGTSRRDRLQPST